MSKVDLGERYELRREIGSGGAGRVFLVHDRYLGRDVALKRLHRGWRDPLEVEAFKDEFSLLARIEHPSIARAFDFGYLGDRPYFTSEFVAGTPLDTWAPGALKAPAEVLSRTLDIAEALAFLHRNGILHLDVKPGNIVVPGEDSRRRAVLIDFGLFRRAFTSPPGSFLEGTLPYMAPEYFRGEKLGPPTDVYALGVTLYRILTHGFPRHPFPGGGGIDPSFRPEPPVPPCMGGRASPELESIVFKCLAMDPASRYPSAVELLEALRAIERSDAPRGHEPPVTIRTIGRRSEIDRIESFLKGFTIQAGAEPVRAAGPIVLAMTGPPGLGQSHLMREVKVRAQVRGIQVSLETGYAGHTTAPGSLLRFLGLPTDPAGRRAVRRWRAFLSSLERRRSAQEHATLEGERRLRRAAEMALAVKAVRKPMVIAADGLQFWDEISTSLVVDLARHLGDMDPAERPPLGLVLGYREEGPCAPLLRELTGYLLVEGRGEIITLEPLDVFETIELHGILRCKDAAEEGGFRLFQETGGFPARIHARARGAGDPECTPGRQSTAGGSGVALPQSKAEHRVLRILLLLERPAAAGEIARMAGLTGRLLKECLSNLEDAHLVEENRGNGSGLRWLAGPAAGELLARIDPDERSRLHLRIARHLCRTKEHHEARLVEAVHHFASAGSKGNVVRYGLPAARYLKATLQSRASLHLFRDVLHAIPPGRVAQRVKVGVAIAELQAGLGDIDDGIVILRDLLRLSPGLAHPLRGKVLLWLATLHSRQGEYRRADSLFGKAFCSVKGSDLELEARLLFLNEYASLKGLLGRYGDATALCDEGLRLAARSRKSRVRELVLYLSATRAAVAQRTFQHEAAIRDFEAALEMAEALGSQASQAVLLNNLGIAYNNRDRHADAIRAFREAESISCRLDEGPSLLSIHGNLAVLNAKTGDFREMERSLAAVVRLSQASPGRRSALFLEHSHGLSRLYQGRPAAALPHLEASRRLADEAGDRLLSAFDSVHRLEALVFTGRYAEALAEGERLSGDGSPPHLRRMVRARQAFLHSILGEADSVERLAREIEDLDESRPPSFLEAWNQLYLGWASSWIVPPGEAGSRHLSRAQCFFTEHGLRPAAALVRWIQAEACFLRGETGEAMLLLDPDPGPGNGLASPLNPLLRARILARSSSEPERCADLLAEAGSRLIESPMPEWSLRARVLRSLLQASPREEASEIEEGRRRLTRGLPDATCRRYLGSAWWRAWTEGRSPRRRPARRRLEPPGKPPAPAGEENRPGTEAASTMERGTRSALVARSRAMRRLVAELDRIRASDLPVLISGETGTGKETVARLIHDESRRASGPFVVVDCATLPEELLETELFGARKGAFSGMASDHSGLLGSAGGGSVLLDEITFASLGVQAKLLRVLSGQGFRPLGSEEVTRADVRFLFSTSRDLEEEVRERRFRPEILHRIRVLEVRVPPLRERIEDLPGLVEILLAGGNRAPPRLEEGVLERLSGLPWPGNVRELKNFLARLSVENGRSISIEAVDRSGLEPKTGTVFPSNLLATKPLGVLKDSLERDYIIYHLHRLRFDTRKVSEFLGVSLQRFYRLCRRLGIRLWERRRLDGRSGDAR